MHLYTCVLDVDKAVEAKRRRDDIASGVLVESLDIGDSVYIYTYIFLYMHIYVCA